MTFNHGRDAYIYIVVNVNRVVRACYEFTVAQSAVTPQTDWTYPTYSSVPSPCRATPAPSYGDVEQRLRTGDHLQSRKHVPEVGLLEACQVTYVMGK